MISYYLKRKFTINDGIPVQVENGTYDREVLDESAFNYDRLAQEIYLKSDNTFVFLQMGNLFAEDGMSGEIVVRAIALADYLTIELDVTFDNYAEALLASIKPMDYITLDDNVSYGVSSSGPVIDKYNNSSKRDRLMELDYTGLLRSNLIEARHGQLMCLRYVRTGDYIDNAMIVNTDLRKQSAGLRIAKDDIDALIKKCSKKGQDRYQPVPINFICRSVGSNRSNFPEYIARELYVNNLLATTEIADITVNSKTTSLPTQSIVERMFSGWLVVIRVIGNVKPELLREIGYLWNDANPKDICMFIDVSQMPDEDAQDAFVKNLKGTSSRAFLMIEPKYIERIEDAVKYLNTKMKTMYSPENRPHSVMWKKLIGERKKYEYGFLDRVFVEYMTRYTAKKNGIASLGKHFTAPALIDRANVMSTATIDRPVTKSAKGKKVPPMKQLKSLIGLDNVKTRVDKMIAFHRMCKEYTSRGMVVNMPSLNMVFHGEPGTAKTTCARLIADIFSKEKMIPKGTFKELSRKDLCADYIGQTATKTAKLLDEVKDGGVVFIDEAYSLTYSGIRNDYGTEAINELVAAMDNMPQTVFIFAGYKKEMEEFIKSNTGLASRIPNVLSFESYTLEQLMEIFHKKLDGQGFVMSKEVSDYFRKKVSKDMKGKHFGNGRYIRTLVEQAVMNHSLRLYGNEFTDEELKTIVKEDIPEMNKLDTEVNKIGFVTK